MANTDEKFQPCRLERHASNAMIGLLAGRLCLNKKGQEAEIVTYDAPARRRLAKLARLIAAELIAEPKPEEEAATTE